MINCIEPLHLIGSFCNWASPETTLLIFVKRPALIHIPGTVLWASQDSTFLAGKVTAELLILNYPCTYPCIHPHTFLSFFHLFILSFIHLLARNMCIEKPHLFPGIFLSA